MCSLSNGVNARGIAKSRMEGILISGKNLMENIGWSVEQIMMALNIPKSGRSVLLC